MVERVLLLGGGAREHAIGDALCRTGRTALFTIANNHNPGLRRLSQEYERHEETDVRWVTDWAIKQQVDFAVVGLEDPLSTGVVDALEQVGILTVGPKEGAARIETSKLFMRELMMRHGIPGQVQYHYFSDPRQLTAFLSAAHGQYAIKPVGLTAGQGVRVMGEQLRTLDEAIDYGRRVIEESIGGVAGVVVEERLLGQEFTLQCFVDGETVVPMPLVRDYKRALEGNKGNNTGSMGSYSQADGLLPYVDRRMRDQALDILARVTQALAKEKEPYKGVMYGQFMATGKGVKLVEINARFGDPEAINVLPLLRTDFVDVCKAIIAGALRKVRIEFEPKATVCTYITPPDYGTTPKAGVPLRVDESAIQREDVCLFYAKLEEGDGQLLTTRSRSLALLGVAESVRAAHERVEKAMRYVSGEYHARHDIGNEAFVAQPVNGQPINSYTR